MLVQISASLLRVQYCFLLTTLDDIFRVLYLVFFTTISLIPRVRYTVLKLIQLPRISITIFHLGNKKVTIDIQWTQQDHCELDMNQDPLH